MCEAIRTEMPATQWPKDIFGLLRNVYTGKAEQELVQCLTWVVLNVSLVDFTKLFKSNFVSDLLPLTEIEIPGKIRVSFRFRFCEIILDRNLLENRLQQWSHQDFENNSCKLTIFPHNAPIDYDHTWMYFHRSCWFLDIVNHNWKWFTGFSYAELLYHKGSILNMNYGCVGDKWFVHGPFSRKSNKLKLKWSRCQLWFAFIKDITSRHTYFYCNIYY